MRRVFWLLIAVLSVSVLFAQEDIIGTEPALNTGIFPLAMVLEGAEFAGNEYGTGLGNIWRPDWPLELPPDSFKVQSGNISGITVEGDGISLVLRYGRGGKIEEFPFMLDGKMAQVALLYDENKDVREINMTFQGEEEPWNLEFLEYNNSYPALVRASCGDVWYFISLSRGGGVITETWYDEEGNALGAYAFSLSRIGEYIKINTVKDYLDPNGITEYFYDSRNFLTESTGPGGEFKVLFYREDLPRYWERRPAIGYMDGSTAGNFSLQWDERGLLLRIARETENFPEAGDRGDILVDYRYKYTLDEKGNWIERREIRMIRSLGLLIPSPGTIFRRVLEYR